MAVPALLSQRRLKCQIVIALQFLPKLNQNADHDLAKASHMFDGIRRMFCHPRVVPISRSLLRHEWRDGVDPATFPDWSIQISLHNARHSPRFPKLSNTGPLSAFPLG